MPSSSEGSRVWSPSRLAATWSAEMPERKLAPAVFRGWQPVRKADEARAWSPAAVAVGPGLVAGQAAEDEQVVAERGQRLEDGRQLEVGPFGRRRPVGHVAPLGT